MACTQVTIGIFKVGELAPGRWQLFNELTGATHVTFGSAEEVTTKALDQSKAWKKRIAAAKAPGAGWRRVKG